MEGIDTSMDGFNHQYTIREGVVYWRHHPINDADPVTFQALGGNWGVDCKAVFGQNKKKKIDRTTFRFLNPVFVVDAKAVYDLSGPIKGADPTSFEALDPGIETDWDILQETRNRGYGRDRRQVFYDDQMAGRATAIRGADPASFRSFRNGYGMDLESIYYGKARIKNSDPSSWTFLGRCYCADKERIFYCEREMAGVERARFTVIGLPTSGNYATDGKRWFENDVEIPAKDFLDKIEDTIEIFGGWFTNNPLMKEGRDHGT
jgi:hypothetical protein